MAPPIRPGRPGILSGVMAGGMLMASLIAVAGRNEVDRGRLRMRQRHSGPAQAVHSVMRRIRRRVRGDVIAEPRTQTYVASRRGYQELFAVRREFEGDLPVVQPGGQIELRDHFPCPRAAGAQSQVA
jgi:hypothetical protein